MMEGKIDKMPEYSRLYEVDIETWKIIDMVGGRIRDKSWHNILEAV